MAPKTKTSNKVCTKISEQQTASHDLNFKSPKDLQTASFDFMISPKDSQNNIFEKKDDIEKIGSKKQSESDESS